MDITKILSQLRSERAQINEAIAVLERMGGGVGGKRRGRPPKWMSEAPETSVVDEAASRERKHFSEETRRRMAEAQRKRWAAAREQLHSSTLRD